MSRRVRDLKGAHHSRYQSDEGDALIAVASDGGLVVKSGGRIVAEFYPEKASKIAVAIADAIEESD